VLETPDGTLIYESKVIMEFAEEHSKDKGYKLLTGDAVKDALIRLDQERFAKFPLYFILYMAKTESEIAEATTKYREGLVEIEKFFKDRGVHEGGN